MFQKYQVTFAKRGLAKFLSHHDVMRAFQRAARRADLPVRMTQGFNPRPRIVFPHALELGVESEDEAAEIELETWVQPAKFRGALADALPTGLDLLEVRLLPPRRKGLTAVEAVYAVELAEADAATAAEGVPKLLAAAEHKLLRPRADGPSKEVDVRAGLADIALKGLTLTMRLKLGQPGAARPREVLAAVLDKPVDALLSVIIRKTKTVLAA